MINKIDKGTLIALVCALLVVFASFARIDTLNKIIKSAAVCEAYGLTKKTHAFGEKSEIITVQCE